MTTDNHSIPESLERREELQFIDRRDPQIQRNSPGLERRQFADGYGNLSPAAAELGMAIDGYKLEKRRRYISYEEMLMIVKSLGYTKNNQG